MCCFLTFCSVTPGPAMIRAVYEYSRLILITVVIFVLLRFPSETPELNCIKPNDYSFLGWTSWKSRFSSALILQKNTFRSEIMRYNDLEQTNTLFLRENRNQNASNSANAICIHVALGQMDDLESVYCFLLFWTVYCQFYPMFSTVLIRLTMYGFARS